ncbi:hypothetical protein RYX36_023649 [Vicia faba]
MNPPRKQRMRLPMQIARTKKADALMRSSSSRNFLLIIKFSLIPRHGYWTVNESWYRFEIFLKMDTGIVTKLRGGGGEDDNKDDYRCMRYDLIRLNVHVPPH